MVRTFVQVGQLRAQFDQSAVEMALNGPARFSQKISALLHGKALKMDKHKGFALPT